MKNIIKITRNIRYIVIFSLLFTISCSKDFLDVESNEKLEDALTSDRSVELVNAIYNRLIQWPMSSFSWIGISSITTDDANKGSDLGDTGTDKHLLDGLTFDPTTISIAESWSEHYNANQRVTQAILRIKEFDDLDKTLQARLIGEAKFLRALIYFRLVKVFGGVPLISDKSDLKSEDALKRASKEDTYSFIEQDLKDAILALPEKSEYPTSELGRATKGAARALLAKVSMYQNKWQKVYDLTDEIIKSNQYSLTPNYEDIWKEIGENNSESIFEIQARGDAPTAGVQGYSVSQGARGEGGWGWGFNTPTKDLANSYEIGDLRKDATIIFKGETLYDGRKVPTTVVNDRYNQKAYSSASSDAWETGKNIRILRYAEVLLMNAEAALEIGEDAKIPLNKVRHRAGLPNVSTINKMDVWKERRHELAFEHDRYFDLVRQGRAGEVLRTHGKPFVDGKHELFPIPQQQIDKSNGLLLQNPGY